MLHRLVNGREVTWDEPLLPAIDRGVLAGTGGDKHGGMRFLVGRGHHADHPHFIIRADFPVGAALARQLIGRVACDPGLVGIGDLEELAVIRHRILSPAFEHDVHLFFENLAVQLVIGGAVRQRGFGVVVLSDNIGPARLVAARESGKEASLQNVIEDRTLLGYPHRVLGAHHIAQRAHAQVFRQPGPPGVQHARVGANLVAFRVEMVFDGTKAPVAQLIGSLGQLRPVADDLLVALAVAPDRTQGLALLARRGDDRIELDNRLDTHTFLLFRLLAMSYWLLANKGIPETGRDWQPEDPIRKLFFLVLLMAQRLSEK